MDIVKEANLLLGRINFSQTGEVSNGHYKVEVQVTPLSARIKGFDNPQDPASDVIVDIFPVQEGPNYNLFAQAERQCLGLKFTNCRCRSAGHNLRISSRAWDPTGVWYPTGGVSVSFVHNYGCLKAGFKLQFKKRS